MIRLFDEERLGAQAQAAAMRHAADGLSLHVWTARPEDWPEAPAVFLQEASKGRPWAHLYGPDEAELVEVARQAGVVAAAVHRGGTLARHVDVCGVPLARLIAACDPEGPVDEVVVGDCRTVLPGRWRPGCVSLVLTSPPYNVGMEYEAGGVKDGGLTFEQWLVFLGECMEGCWRLLQPGGHLVVNVPQGVGRSGDWPYQPVASSVASLLHQPPARRVVAEVVWDKGATRQNSTAWGSYMKPSAPSVRDCHEMLILARKAGGPLRPSVLSAQADISRDEFLACTLSIWRGLGTVSQEGHSWHPAPFPLSLATRVVRFLSYPGDLVLDPFLGSGTTGAACKALGRRWIGVELDREFARRAAGRVAGAGMQGGLPGFEDCEEVRG